MPTKNPNRDPNDYYATPPSAVEDLLSRETFADNIWEPACGQGHISEKLSAAGHKVVSSDLIDRGYGNTGINFLVCTKNWKGDIVTNPPYSMALEFVEKALEVVSEGSKVAMLLDLNFLAGQKRGKFFADHPIQTVYVYSKRIACARGGDFAALQCRGTSRTNYAWFIWTKGYSGPTTVRWLAS